MPPKVNLSWCCDTSGTPATAEKLRDALYELATDIDTADEPAARYGLLIGMYEERA
ncbi:MAG: hypothetical protein ACRDP8_04270 [Actinopolymorphaceae bacterium]